MYTKKRKKKKHVYYAFSEANWKSIFKKLEM